jgi:RNA polymerase sigma-70 factor (ECF subfamily)
MTSAIVRQPETESLIQRLLARDTTALAELYDLYGNLVYATALRVVRDQATAEDLTQDIFLRVWHRVPSFDPTRGSLSGWVMTIARNSAIDHWRSHNGQRARFEISINDLMPTMSGGEEVRELESLPEASRVRVAMERLKPQHRHLLHLAYFEGLSQSEMAHRLKLPLGTIKTWIGCALRQLRVHLAATRWCANGYARQTFEPEIHRVKANCLKVH